MNRARSFFFVCLGVLCLAITYHLGARSAGAQSGTIDAGNVWYCSADCAAAVIGRTYYRDGAPIPNGPIPGTAPVVAVGVGSNGCPAVMLANGDIYRTHPTSTGPWTFDGNAVGNATPAQSISVGRLKATYAK